jgi:murein DD-endopeptidase MepM/ murein hydrolase activator NlpD
MRLKFNWPLQSGRLTSRFGPRRRHCHTGIDIAAPVGTSVRAAAAGRVVFSGRRRGYGNLIIIQHNTVYSTAYAHLSTRAVRRGQRVRQGRVLATVGRSARSTGPHLHFEVRVRQQARDPIFYLPHPPKRLRWK